MFWTYISKTEKMVSQYKWHENHFISAFIPYLYSSSVSIYEVFIVIRMLISICRERLNVLTKWTNDVVKGAIVAVTHPGSSTRWLGMAPLRHNVNERLPAPFRACQMWECLQTVKIMASSALYVSILLRFPLAVGPPSTTRTICLWLLIDSTSQADRIVPTAEGRGHWLRKRQTWPSRKWPAARDWTL